MSKRTGDMIGVRMDKDVEILVGMALKERRFLNASRIGNEALRKYLTPMFPSKRVAALQKEMGVQA